MEDLQRIMHGMSLEEWGDRPLIRQLKDDLARLRALPLNPWSGPEGRARLKEYVEAAIDYDMAPDLEARAAAFKRASRPLLQEFVSSLLHEVFGPIKDAAILVARLRTTGRIRRYVRQARAEHRRRHPKAHRGGKW